MTETVNLAALAKQIGDEDAARERFEAMRWPNGAACPHCGGANPYKLTPKATSTKPGRKGLFKCRACRRQFTVTVGTVFEDSRIPLSKWILALHLLGSSKKGMSAHQLHRNLGISYKAAWFMAHRIRYAMKNGGLGGLMTGTVEVDETYVGAKHKRGTRRGRPGPDSHKTPVVALVERGTGRVRAFPMPRVTSDNLREAVKGHVHPDAELMTDDYYAYRTVGEMQKRHGVLKHSNKEYVRGNDHTNTVEGFFSVLKRGINGVYQHVSLGHLSRYCDEFAFRYENRAAVGVTDGERAALIMKGANGKRLTCKQPASAS